MTIIVLVAMKKSAIERVLVFNSPPRIPMDPLSNSARSHAMAINVTTEITTYPDSVLFIGNSYHKDTEATELHDA